MIDLIKVAGMSFVSGVAFATVFWVFILYLVSEEENDSV